MQIKRSLWGDLKGHLGAPEISLLIGPRQAGKTTLLKAIQEEVRQSGRPVLFFNLDIQADERHFSSQERLLHRIQLETGLQPALIIIDEVQRLRDAGRFLKGLYDQGLPYKFMVSGSGSLELKEQISESLVGRKRVFTLYTVSPTEFLHYRTGYRYTGKLSQWARLEPEQAELLLFEYLNFGGYPRVVTAVTKEERLQVLREILESYLLRDIVGLLKLERSDAFATMLRLLADQIGQMTSYTNLAQQTMIATPTLKKYLWYAEKTFIIERISPFFRNAVKELTKAPHYYFVDTGFRNLLLNMAGKYQDQVQIGFLFQNLVWRLLQARFEDQFMPIHYWRTKDKAEVDFVIKTVGQEVLPVEVKAGHLQKPTVAPSLRSFIQTYQPREAWIVNRSLETQLSIGQTKVLFKPWYDLLE